MTEYRNFDFGSAEWHTRESIYCLRISLNES